MMKSSWQVQRSISGGSLVRLAMLALLACAFIGGAAQARSGAGGAKVIATYVVEKGKPLASPA
jgi:hypothetical protein